MAEEHRQQASHDDGDRHGLGAHALDGPFADADQQRVLVIRRAGCPALLASCHALASLCSRQRQEVAQRRCRVLLAMHDEMALTRHGRQRGGQSN